MLNIKPEVAAFFKIRTNASNLFIYGQSAFESWTPESHITPSTGQIWLWGSVNPNLIAELYIGYSAVDLICFASQRPHSLLRHPEQRAFAALGLLPTVQQADYLKALFPFARWHLLFGPDLLGKIADASIAAWFKNNPVSFRFTDNKIASRYRDKIFHFDPGSFSLHRFEFATGMRSGIRTHKPPRGYLSFIDLQKKNSHDTGTV